MGSVSLRGGSESHADLWGNPSWRSEFIQVCNGWVVFNSFSRRGFGDYWDPCPVPRYDPHKRWAPDKFQCFFLSFGVKMPPLVKNHRLPIAGNGCSLASFYASLLGKVFQSWPLFSREGKFDHVFSCYPHFFFVGGQPFKEHSFSGQRWQILKKIRSQQPPWLVRALYQNRWQQPGRQ